MLITLGEVCQNGSRANSFQNLRLQTHQSECYQIWVATLAQGRDVKLWRPCWSHDHKCLKMADLVDVWENHVNSFKNLPLQTHQSEWHQILVTKLGPGPDKLQVQWSYFYLFICSLWLLGCIIFLGRSCAADAMPRYQQAGTHFANLGRRTGWVNPTRC